MSEIALIPRGYRRMGKEERKAFAIKAKEEDEKSLSRDEAETKRLAQAFERKTAEDLKRLKGQIC